MIKKNKLKLTVSFLIIAIAFAVVCSAHIDYWNGNTIPVAAYHHIVESIPQGEKSTVAVTVDEFESHIKAYIENGYRVITLDELYTVLSAKIKLNEKLMVITFDDGYKSNYTYALPILKKYNVKANVNLVAAYINNNDTSLPMLSWDEIREMEESGCFKFYNHGYYHVDYAKVDSDVMVKSLQDAEDMLSNHLLYHDVRVFAYPYGSRNFWTTRKLASIGFKMQLLSENAHIRSNTSLTAIPRMSIPSGLSGKEAIAYMNQFK